MNVYYLSDFYLNCYMLISDCFIDVAFVIDESGSIRDSNVDGQPDNWGLIIDFIKSVVRGVNIGPTQSRAAAVNFGNFKQTNKQTLTKIYSKEKHTNKNVFKQTIISKTHKQRHLQTDK